eukprot:IDg21211t1
MSSGNVKDEAGDPMTGLSRNEGVLPVSVSGSGHQEQDIHPPEEYMNDSNDDEDNAPSSFTRDWMDQMTRSMTSMVDQMGKLINAVEQVQESGKALHDAIMRTSNELERKENTTAPTVNNLVMEENRGRESSVAKETPLKIYEHRYDLRLVHRIYSDSLHNTRVSKIPDYRFETAYMTWTRLNTDVPINENHKRALMSLAFEGIALRTFEEIAASNPKASSEELWKKLRDRLCNESQVMSLRSAFMNMKYHERKETVQAYANRLRSSALNLPEEISSDMLVSRFVQGLPNRLRLAALSVQGSFDEVVSRVSLISAEFRMEREVFKEISELPAPTTTEAPHRLIGVIDRPRERVCYFCRKSGHISRYCPERLEREKKRSEMKGKDLGQPAKENAGAHFKEAEIVKIMRDDECDSSCFMDELAVEITVNGMKINAEIDTGAYSIWVNLDWFLKQGGIVEPDYGEARGADQSKLDVKGSGRLSFGLWGSYFRNYPVRLLGDLKSDVLIGRSFWINYRLKMDLEVGKGAILVNGKQFSGIMNVPIQVNKEIVSSIDEEEEIDMKIKSMDLSGFSPHLKFQDALRELLWDKRHIFKGVGSIKNITHKIKLKEGSKPVMLPMRRRSPVEARSRKA